MSKTNQKPAVLKTCTAAARAAEAHAQQASYAEESALNAAEAANRSAVRAAAALADMEAAHASMNRCINAAIILAGLSVGFTIASVVL